MAKERIQKILARAGIASRRAAEELMLAGEVSVNGEIAKRLGMQADPEVDHIRVRGKLLDPKRLAGPHHYYVAFKPTKMISSLDDPEGRETVADLLRAHKVRARVYPVGRLDWDADGLLLLTDDGDLAARVMHPRTHLPKTYRVKVKGAPSEALLSRLRRGIVLERGERPTLPAEIRVESTLETTTWLRVVIAEGRKNQIKLMCQRIGHPVRRIRRVAIGPLTLGRMKPGDLRELGASEVEALRRALESPAGGRRKGGASSRRAHGPSRSSKGSSRSARSATRRSKKRT